MLHLSLPFYLLPHLSYLLPPLFYCWFPPECFLNLIYCIFHHILTLFYFFWSDVKSPSCVRLFATPSTAAYPAPSMRFSRQEYWSGLPFPSPGDLSDPLLNISCIFSILVSRLFICNSILFSRFWIIFTIIWNSLSGRSPVFCLVWWAFILFLYLLGISLPFHLVYIAVFGVAFPYSGSLWSSLYCGVSSLWVGLQRLQKILSVIKLPQQSLCTNWKN